LIGAWKDLHELWSISDSAASERANPSPSASIE